MTDARREANRADMRVRIVRNGISPRGSVDTTRSYGVFADYG